MYNNSTDLHKEKENKNLFVNALSEFKTNNNNVNNQSNFMNNFNNSYKQAGGQGDALSTMGNLFGQKLALLGSNSSEGTGSTGGNTPWGLIGQIGKQGYNAISGHDDKNYSDLEQSTIYPLQGASMGAQFGPYGAAGGALYGLGYSLKDDIGLKDSNFLTQMLFPIGMGDGGGLRISGKPVLDLG